jgi:tetratricopeptide (TPR) repeat protein
MADDQHRSSSPETPLWGSLRSGPHTVGFSSAYQSEIASNPGIDWDMERSLKDLDYLVNWMMQHHPGVTGQPVAVMGQSYGAQAAIGWTAERNAVVDAVVAFDSTLENSSPDWKVWEPLQARLERTVNLSTPMLLFAQDTPSTSFDRCEGLKYAERYYAKVRHLGHNDFLSHCAIGSDIRLRLKPDAPKEAFIRQGYDLVCVYTRRFLDAYLKGHQEALQSLRSASASDDLISGLLSLQYRAAAPLPPTSKQFLDRIRSHGLAEARCFFGHFQNELDDRVLEYVGYRLFDDGRIDEAIEVHKLNTEWCPRSTRAWDELGYAHQAKGEPDLALSAFKEASQWVADDPALGEHERWLRTNSLSEALGEVQG